MRAYITQHPIVPILAGYAVALAGTWWLVAETLAGRWMPLGLVSVAAVSFFLGLRTGLAAQPAPAAADAADPMPEAVEATPRPAAIALGTAHRA
jgi:hypothetical protein